MGSLGNSFVNSYNSRTNPYRKRNEEQTPPTRTTTGVKAGGDINTSKKWRVGEEAAHNFISSVLAELKQNDGEMLYLEVLERRIEREQNPDAKRIIEGILDNSFHSFMRQARRDKVNKPNTKKLANQIQKKAMTLELKYLKIEANRDLSGDFVKNYFKDKSDNEKDAIVSALLKDYKSNRTEGNMTKTNNILGYFNKKIVRVNKMTADLNNRKVARFDFEGSFNFPSVDKEEKGGYSSGYAKIVESYKRGLSKGVNYYKENKQKSSNSADSGINLDQHPAILAIAKSSNMSLMLPKIKAEMKIVMPFMTDKEFLALNVSDIGHMLYKSRHNGEEPSVNDFLTFGEINPSCNEGAKKQFWKDFAQDDKKWKLLEENMIKNGYNDENYFSDLRNEMLTKGSVVLEKIDDPELYKQPTPKVSLHHKFYVQDVGGLGENGVKFINDAKNFAVAVDFNNNGYHESGLHYIDTNVQDDDGKEYSERLVDLRDGKNNDRLVLTSGWGKDTYVKIELEEVPHQTYQDKEYIPSLGNLGRN